MSKHWMDKVWSWDHRQPPIRGWAFGHLRHRLTEGAGPARLADAYDKLSRWTEFWLTARRSPGAALPHYQHGNDSGWDNATTFDPERVVVTADLAALLVLQLRALADWAQELGRLDDALRWTREADRTQAPMFDELWDDGRFVARSADGGTTWGGSSLLDLMPMVRGSTCPTTSVPHRHTDWRDT
ncbi:hypothetical protein KBY46_00665 [Streptomyces sp. 404i]|nr:MULTISPECIES: hypothetical protein [unclassified Streptomyces]MBQ1104436.1 hypothetical protein [Streptomyces sp. 404i]MBQ1116052.1 hypothetical protein [Streptomyces sp. C3-3]